MWRLSLFVLAMTVVFGCGDELETDVGPVVVASISSSSPSASPTRSPSPSPSPTPSPSVSPSPSPSPTAGGPGSRP